MKKTLLLLMTLLTVMGTAKADQIAVGSVTIPQGGTAQVAVSLTNPDHTYTAGQMALALPEGVSAVLTTGGDPQVTAGERFAGANHSFGASHLADGTEQFTIFSVNSMAIPGSGGVLLYATVTADETLPVGTVLEGSLTGIELTTVDGQRTPFSDQMFTITVGEPADTHVLLDENATSLPEAADGVDIRVRRTIPAGEWSTICLPFVMTEAQCKEVFGSDVQLGDFTGADSEFDDADNVVGIKVNFSSVAAIEANHPYIIKVSQPVEEFTLDGVDIVADEDEAYIEFDNGRTGSRRVVYSGFYGTYHAGTVLDEYTLFLSDNQFWYSTGQTEMKAFRAYFAFLDVLTELDDTYSSRISIVFGGETTGISQIEDGKLKIGNGLYDLQGRRVESSILNSQSSTTKKGLYIVNGKKIIK